MKNVEPRVDSDLEPAEGIKDVVPFAECMSRLRLRVVQRNSPELYPRVGFIPAHRPLAGDLDLCLVSDQAGTAELVSAVWLNGQRVSIAEAERCALKNGAKDQNYTAVHKGDVYRFNSVNGLVLADLLVDESRRQELMVDSPVVALMFDQLTLLTACGNDPAALITMAELALQFLPETKSFCSWQPIVLRDNGWEPFALPAPLMPIFAKLRGGMRFTQLVNAQVELSRLLKSEGKDEGIARVMRTGKPGTDAALMAVCVSGQTTLVPEVDFLSCIDPVSGVCFYVRWADVQRFSPNSLQATPWPSFWRTTDFLYGADVREHSFTILPPVEKVA